MSDVARTGTRDRLRDRPGSSGAEHQAMSKLVRLVDFQVYARPSGLPNGEQRPIDEGLFTTFEPVRLWLKEHEIRAPFR
jgi:hypothetical protein